MDISYFNYSTRLIEGWWQRRRFIANWRRFYREDPRWVPPYYPALWQMLKPGYHPHLARLNPLLVQTEALPRRKDRPPELYAAPMFELPVASAIVLADPRRQDGTAYLARLHCVNDVVSLERLLDDLQRPLYAAGRHRLILPTGLSPHLGSGLLQDYWHRLPPLHTPYNPPYLPEMAAGLLRPLTRLRLYTLAVPAEPPPVSDGPARLIPLEPNRLAGDLLPLFRTACANRIGLPLPDEAETDFILGQLQRWPLFGWLALVEEQPVGFVLMQPDLADRLRRAGGGRNPLWRLWLRWAARRPVAQGRILYAAVLSDWQRQGIGRQLLGQALLSAQQRSWQHLTVGPVSAIGSAAKFLDQSGAEARQTYLLYQLDL